MSAYEWVIEQESPDGVTTRIVFDFADDEAGSHGNGGRVSVSSSTHHSHLRRDGRGRGLSSGAPGGGGGGGGIFAFKEAARSEGGSSRRSSKRSNGSRSRCPRHQHLSSSSRGGAFLGGARASESGSSTMAGPIGSAYTSAALWQRYQRVLFGGGRGGMAAAVAGVARALATTHEASSPISASALASSTRADPSAGLHGGTHYFSLSSPPEAIKGGQPPSTVLMSADGVEAGDEERQESRGCQARRTRCGRGIGRSSGSCESRDVTYSEGASAAVGTGAATQAHTTGGSARHLPAQMASSTTAALAPPSSGNDRSGEGREGIEDYEDLDDADMASVNGSYYVLRDVWATRAACPRTISATSTADFPAFPPLHPISVEEEAGSAETVIDSRGGPSGTAGVCNGLASTAGVHAEDPASLAPAKSLEGDDPRAPAESPRRYNKMLLKKERQWRRRRGGQPTASSGGSTLLSCKRLGVCAGESSRGLCGSTSACVSRRGRQESTVSTVDQFDDRRQRSSGALYNSEDDVDDDSCDTSLSSLECLSTSSSDDFHARQLRADSVFTATVQSLAIRAERERKKMEAREEQMLRGEAVQNKEWLRTQRPPLSSQAACGSQLPSASTAAGGTMRHSEVCSNTGGSGAISSFFISPIHQFVAAESADWAAGTEFQFLGQGGLGRGDITTSFPFASLRPSQVVPRRGTCAPVRAAAGRRRGRSDDNEGETGAMSSTGGEATLTSETHGNTTDAQTGFRRARKKRKRGDCARQAVVGECGGSRALRPVAAPSNGPPLEILPCSKKDMREDLLESFLMEVVLDEDDFQFS
ncbi:hypothetical protein LSCM1_02776 [Leishmania martiniquensis]|uniref:Uncharacterized protein n=1 Tax=Leishmania martiniquensis TaxID=1580590 RepID=A0A836KKZ2_9TRYP|nr:hypothetical protein LSCM1_02776 [Leishmania martiniquensis]